MAENNSQTFITASATVSSSVTLTITGQLASQTISFLSAYLSLLPHNVVPPSSISPTNTQLKSVSGGHIEVLGEAVLPIAICSLRRQYSWRFIFTKSTPAILGLDFLSHYDFHLDCKRGILKDSYTTLSVSC